AVPIIGYGSHVQTELLVQARAAGCTTVLPRSVFVQQLPRLLVP
ncbi:MAG: response regulator, partial [Candidatus Omnitrophica bacterium]|nr:response regulator [Candidatus Omnitrophota bacterium]